MEQKNALRMVYKLHSKELKKEKWKLYRPLDEAMKLYPDCIVSLNDSQVLRFIDDINGASNVGGKVKDIQRKIKWVKKQPKSKETKKQISDYYAALYDLQFQRDYVTVVMDSNADYDRTNKGFSIDFGMVNGGRCVVHYHRFLGTNGGIKNSTIVYVNEAIYPELKKRLDNGRKKDVPLVPAKLEAYQALVCSGSVPLPEPKGFIVVDDCITHFKEDVIMISDEGEGEPKLTYVDNYEVEHNDSDGYGLMSPEYSRQVNAYFGGDKDKTVSGMNTRYAWTKGMVYTFDFEKFGKEIADNYIIKDAWGDERDVRKADVILTVSMLKLWDCYDSWEDYYRNCQENGYQFSATKLTPNELENVRNTNYQFLQSYEFSDDELEELCRPTIDEIQEVLGLDYRKSIVFLAGFGLNDDNVMNVSSNYIKALMIDRRMINDPYVRKSIYSMIKKRIELAKKGSIKINANYAMISGDPYALAQNMFGLEVTGLLKAGEMYHRYWSDKGAKELACFRAPMTCMNNILKLSLADTEQARYWFEYMDAVVVLNAWDTSCDALNGCDFDGDTAMCTDNPIILANTKQTRTIMCVQRRAEKKDVSEEDIVAANKLAFNDEIGAVTNRVTTMFDVQAGYGKGSKEYETLAYRIMCGQNFQQATIDRCKGIIAKPMPEYWYDYSANKIKDEDDAATVAKKKFNQSIVADNKPYFMIYVYPQLKRKLQLYMNNNLSDMRTTFSDYRFKTMEELYNYSPKTPQMADFLHYYEQGICVGRNPCVVNRICWIYEREFPSYSALMSNAPDFDYSILKSDSTYSRNDYNAISKLYKEYKYRFDSYRQRTRTYGFSDETNEYSYEDFVRQFRTEAQKICPNAQELCDIVVDICYRKESSKQFAWDVAGDTIIENLLKRNKYKLSYPSHSGSEFEYAGEMFEMKTVDVGEGDIDDYFE